MPSYIISNCLLGTPINFIVTATTLSIGQIVSVNKDEQNYCGMVMSEDDLIPDSVLIGEGFLNCCECLSASTGGDYSSFEFLTCNNNDSIFVDLQTFCNVYGGAPTIGSVFQLFNLDTSEIVCSTFTGASQTTGVTFWIPDEGPYSDCETCLNNIPDLPRSAGTENFVCVICCPCATGETITQVVPPHPDWTDGYGTSVTQLNAITLGGMFGLNS